MTRRTLTAVRCALATLALLSSACSDDASTASPASGEGTRGAEVTGSTATTISGVSGISSSGGITAGSSSSGGGVFDSSASADSMSSTSSSPAATTGASTATSSGVASSGAGGGTSGAGTGGAGTGGGTSTETTGALGTDSGVTGAGGTGSNTNPDPGEPIGFASLNGGTSGGQAGQTVTVSTYDQLKSYAESSDPVVILVDGTISNGPNGGKVSVQSNKSIIGIGSTAFLNGIGIEIKDSNNIILQNFRISMTGVTTRTDTPGVYTSSDDEGLPKIEVNDGDAISISGTSKNIWIDHCELFSEDPDVQTNKDLYDGLIDIKGQTGFITISWCYLHDHHKGGLVGSSDSDLYSDRKVTFHHNYYSKVKLRVPMYRGAVGHFFNNYVLGAEDATEIRADTCLRVEKNYYEPLHYSIYTPSDAPGSAERIDNIEVNRTSRAYPASCTADIPYSYSDVLTDDTNDVKTVVPQSAGVGKL